MDRNDSEAAVYTDTNEPQDRSGTEIELYEDLIAFAQLTPQQQARLSSELPVNKSLIEEQQQPSSPVSKPDPASSGSVDVTVSETSQVFVPVERDVTKPEIAGPTEITDKRASSDAAEPSSDYARAETSDAYHEVFVRPSGPLGSLTSGIVFSGALSKGVCLACGAESSTDDLFCLTCGVFIEEISLPAPPPSKPVCSGCQKEIASEEIFCPWCGAVLPA